MHLPLRPCAIPRYLRLAALLFVGMLAWASAAAAHAGKARLGPPCVSADSLIGVPAAQADESADREGQSRGESEAGRPSRAAWRSDVPGQDESPIPQAPPAALGQEVCVAAHVYQVVELHDGTRFLDICPATVPDEDCRFILLSRSADREEVGDLKRLGGTQIEARGRLRSINGRFGIFISHARQLDRGPEKFRPNPRLLQEFDPDSDHLPVRDPNLRPSGRRRTFMNRSLREPSAP